MRINLKINSKKVALAIWIISAIAIIAGSLLPDVSVPEEYHFDKIVHGSAYAGLALLAYFFIKNRKRYVLALILLICMGGGIEILQTFIPTRDGTIGDFSADTIGVLCGAWIAKKINQLLLKFTHGENLKFEFGSRKP